MTRYNDSRRIFNKALKEENWVGGEGGSWDRALDAGVGGWTINYFILIFFLTTDDVSFLSPADLKPSEGV